MAARIQALGPEPVPSRDELREDRSVYGQDDLSEVPVIRLTVTDLDGLEDVLESQPGPEVDVLFQEGRLGAGETQPNGKLSLRATNAPAAHQRSIMSYKIVLDEDAGLWKGQKRIHLIKNDRDLNRVRNYLGFEYCKSASKNRKRYASRRAMRWIMARGSKASLFSVRCSSSLLNLR